VRANSNQLRQVLLNLLLNAGQAMEASPVKHITVRTQLTERNVELTLVDTGPGVPDDIKARLFKPFFTTKGRGKGTGLGLSVSRSIIEGHRGAIRVESAPGQGAKFVITLPAVDPNAKPGSISNPGLDPVA
jgi:signal transduction histidine kinase